MLAMPNTFNLDWVYSVPCGEELPNKQRCSSWLFLLPPEKESAWGPHRKDWVKMRLAELEWTEVTNRENRRFVCPGCSKKGQYIFV